MITTHLWSNDRKPWLRATSDEIEAVGDAHARTAKVIATDIMTHQRWGAGVEGQPVYDPRSGRYVGDYANDQIRSTMDGRIMVHVPYAWRLPTEQVVEWVYRILIPDVDRYLEMLDYLREQVEAGTLIADESPETAAARALRNGWRTADLIRATEVAR